MSLLVCFTVGMPLVPSTENSLLVRTSFVDPAAWTDALTAVRTKSQDGFVAAVDVLDDRAWEKADWEQVRSAALAAQEHAAVLFIADDQALVADFPLLVIDLSEASNTPFRCVASELWGVDNNLNIANMDYSEFAEATDQDGVFRGFD